MTNMPRTLNPMGSLCRRSRNTISCKQLFRVTKYDSTMHRLKWCRRCLWSHYDLYVVGQHGVLCEVKLWRFVATSWAAQRRLPLSMGNGNFRPPTESTPLNDRQKLTQVITSATPTAVPNLMHIVRPRGSEWMGEIYTSGYATMVHGRGCNPHRCTTTFANLEITSLWRHWWRHNSETIRDKEKRRPPRAMKSSELSNGENRIALRQLLQYRKLRH